MALSTNGFAEMEMKGETLQTSCIGGEEEGSIQYISQREQRAERTHRFRLGRIGTVSTALKREGKENARRKTSKRKGDWGGQEEWPSRYYSFQNLK